MPRAIIYIGGASQSGKSTLGRLLAETIPIPLYDLDRDPVIKVVRKRRLFGLRGRLIRLYCMIRLALLRGPVIIDCPYLAPGTVASRFFRLDPALVFFAGYPQCDPDTKIAQLKAQNFKHAHHLKWMDDDSLRRAITQLLQLTTRHKEDCEKFGFTFLDFSDVGNLGALQREAVDLIKSRYRAATDRKTAETLEFE